MPRDFAAVTGACLSIRRETFFELGAFDPSYHMYVEDVDLCIRAWDAGLRVTYCPESVVIHLENASVTDVAWRDENVIAGWQRLDERWAGRWPDAVRRFAWPHELAGSPRHLAALCFADDVAEHPELLEEWCRVFRPEEAKLVVYGAGLRPRARARRARSEGCSPEARRFHRLDRRSPLAAPGRRCTPARGHPRGLRRRLEHRPSAASSPPARTPTPRDPRSTSALERGVSAVALVA